MLTRAGEPGDRPAPPVGDQVNLGGQTAPGASQSLAARASLYGGSDLRRDVPRFVDLWRGGRLDLESLITRRIRFEDLNDAIATLERGDAIRQVVLFD